MLILSRRLNEKIVLPDLNITIQVVGLKPGQVRLGIEAPPGVTIFREEILPGTEPSLPSHSQPTILAAKNRLAELLQEIDK